MKAIDVEKCNNLTNNKSDEILSDGVTCSPAVVTVHADVEPLVSRHHSILDGLLLGPDQRQHSPHTNHGVQKTKLKCTHKEVNGLEGQIRERSKPKLSHLEDV